MLTLLGGQGFKSCGLVLSHPSVGSHLVTRFLLLLRGSIVEFRMLGTLDTPPRPPC